MSGSGKKQYRKNRKNSNRTSTQQSYKQSKPKNNIPSASFLAALAAQREKQEKESNQSSESTSSPSIFIQNQHKIIPGYYYDVEKKKYFRSPYTINNCPVVSTEEESKSISESGLIQNQHIKSYKSTSLWSCITRREIIHNSVYTQHDLYKRSFAYCINNRALLPVHIQELIPRQRNCINYMAVQSRQCYVAASRECDGVYIYKLSRRPETQGNSSHHEYLSPCEHRNHSCSQITSMAWQQTVPTLSTPTSALLYSFIDSPGNARQTRSSSYVRLLHLQHGHLDWPFYDPWTVTWSSTQSSIFAVGYHGVKKSGAACVSLDTGNLLQHAPKGSIMSDVLSQEFLPSSPDILLNGTRNKLWWVWDRRLRCRAMEAKRHNMSHTTSQAIVDLKVLSDERQWIAEYSDGEINVLDIRVNRKRENSVVCTLHSPSNVKRKTYYNSRLRIALDENEQFVIVPQNEKNSVSLKCINIRSGQTIANIPPPFSHINASLEQVDLQYINTKENAEIPYIWSYYGTELYRL